LTLEAGRSGEASIHRLSESIPAIRASTTDSFILLKSMVFATPGLHAMHFLAAGKADLFFAQVLTARRGDGHRRQEGAARCRQDTCGGFAGRGDATFAQ
jgi:hypothetical protein